MALQLLGVRCAYRECQRHVDSDQLATWITITVEHRRNKRVYWFCGPTHAASMMARVISEIG